MSAKDYNLYDRYGMAEWLCKITHVLSLMKGLNYKMLHNLQKSVGGGERMCLN